MFLYRYIVKPISKRLVPKPYRPAVKHFVYRIRSLWYIGGKVACPCCGGRFRKFLPYGVHRREGAMCPRCGAMTRHRLLWSFLQENTNLFTDKLRVLHFAPEYVIRKQLISLPNLEYVSADLDSLKAMVKADITHIPFRDETFDVVLCNHVLEHVLDDHAAMRELHRVLVPGGWAILQVPVDRQREETFEDDTIVTPEDRQRCFNQKDHVRIYGLDYKARLKKAKFKVKAVYHARELSEEKRLRYGLRRKQPIYFCTKRVPESREPSSN